MTHQSDDKEQMPCLIHILRDHKGNTLQVGKDISAENALEKLSESYPVTLYTYALKPVKNVTF